jgi:hypothetical protein
MLVVRYTPAVHRWRIGQFTAGEGNTQAPAGGGGQHMTSSPS